jgi:hypothetical protein
VPPEYLVLEVVAICRVTKKIQLSSNAGMLRASGLPQVRRLGPHNAGFAVNPSLARRHLGPCCRETARACGGAGYGHGRKRASNLPHRARESNGDEDRVGGRCDRWLDMGKHDEPSLCHTQACGKTIDKNGIHIKQNRKRM